MSEIERAAPQTQVSGAEIFVAGPLRTDAHAPFLLSKHKRRAWLIPLSVLLHVVLLALIATGLPSSEMKRTATEIITFDVVAGVPAPPAEIALPPTQAQPRAPAPAEPHPARKDQTRPVPKKPTAPRPEAVSGPNVHAPPPVSMAQAGATPAAGAPAASGASPAAPRVRVEPTYPPRARQRGIEGEVEMIFTLLPDGSVNEPQVVRATPEGFFERAALRALRQWRYPAGGRTQEMRVIMRFRLQK